MRRQRVKFFHIFPLFLFLYVSRVFFGGMRTRFLLTDYSDSAIAGDCCDTAGILDFYMLPSAEISAVDSFSASVDALQCLDAVPLVETCIEVEKLETDDALSIFLSDVLPHFVCGEGLVDGEDFKHDEVHAGNTSTKSTNAALFLQFEVPKMDTTLLPLESPLHLEFDGCLCLPSEVPDAEFLSGAPDCEVLLHGCTEILQPVFSVDYMDTKSPVEQNANAMEDTDFPHWTNAYKFPLFELDMDNLGVLQKVCTIDEVLCFDSIEQQQDVINSNFELSEFMKLDLKKYLLPDSSPIQNPVESIVSSPLSYASMIELPQLPEHPFSHGELDDDSISLIESILFDDILFFDIDPFLFSEVFSDSVKEIEVEHCESMFEASMNFRNFSKMVVSHELTPVDDSFKSMPVPIFPDHRSKSSLNALIEELLSKLQRVSSLASDGLYLDWSLLKGDTCGSIRHSYCREMLYVIDTLEVDDNVISTDGGKVIFDFILSEDISCKPDVENVVDSANHNDLLDQYATSVKGDSNVMKGHHGEGKSVFCDVHQKTNVEKLSLFAESMTSDLEFFLHPSNYTKGRACTTGNKTGEAPTAHHILMQSDNSNAPDPIDQETFYVKTQTKPETHSVPEQFCDKIEACASIPAQSMPVSLGSEQNVSCCLVNPKTAIVVNTRNFNEEMIISRRSTYQKILEMEQEGAKVVERDLDLPIDLVISSAICLAWYDSRNIARKSVAPDASCPSLPLCVESLAADILTSLSFAFSCCILIFEGEANFLNEIMESSDELIAAAASLGIDVQLFYSHSSELTEEIIFSCINVATKSGVFYPIISDSESLGESFLTAFPSLNPLSANAILSSDAILCKFMEMSKESRICALQKYMVPSESIALLTATTRYGEREDSKSTMTDCSSSISAPEREDVLFRGESQRKKPKHLHMYDADDHQEEKFPTESVKAFQGDQLFNSWLSGFNEISVKTAPFGDFRRVSDPDMTNFFLNGIRKRPCMIMPQEEISHSPRNCFGSKPNNSGNTTTQYKKGIDFAPENFNGELIDAKGKRGSLNSNIFSAFSFKLGRDQADDRNTKTGKCPFETSASALFSRKSNSQILMEDTISHCEAINQVKNTSTTSKTEEEESSFISYKPPFQSSCNDTPLLNVVQSGRSQSRQETPWKIEFLNRLRENGRVHKQSTLLSSSSSSSSVAVASFTKMKNPSVLELYKGSSARKNRGRSRSSSFKNSLRNAKASVSYSPTWTPVDKRARRTLSFSTNGNGGQSKLVWSNNSHHSVVRRF